MECTELILVKPAARATPAGAALELPVLQAQCSPKEVQQTQQGLQMLTDVEQVSALDFI